MENLKDYFDQQKTSERAFNIFRVLHEETDEKRLHSRFISYLLSNQVFLKSFLERVPITGFETDNVIISPSIKNKSECKDIDILVYNAHQAIIIENKIFAGDSNLQGQEEGYNGQLERYYNTIQKGEKEPGKCIDQREVVSVIYLTLNGRWPSTISLGDIPHEKLKLIDYPKFICEWLKDCILKAEEAQGDLRASISQYRTLVVQLSSDLEQAKKIKDFYAIKSKRNGIFKAAEKTTSQRNVLMCLSM